MRTTETVLLDANVLIALTVQDHAHNDSASAWSLGAGLMATTPIAEGALVRYLLRTGRTGAAAAATLTHIAASGRYVFWPDSLSYTEVSLAGLVGYRQVTDAYLVALAKSRGVRLATFDRALSQAHPADTELVA